jgi:hypothetical protein
VLTDGPVLTGAPCYRRLADRQPQHRGITARTGAGWDAGVRAPRDRYLVAAVRAARTMSALAGVPVSFSNGP